MEFAQYAAFNLAVLAALFHTALRRGGRDARRRREKMGAVILGGLSLRLAS